MTRLTAPKGPRYIAGGASPRNRSATNCCAPTGRQAALPRLHRPFGAEHLSLLSLPGARAPGYSPSPLSGLTTSLLLSTQADPLLLRPLSVAFMLRSLLRRDLLVVSSLSCIRGNLSAVASAKADSRFQFFAVPRCCTRVSRLLFFSALSAFSAVPKKPPGHITASSARECRRRS